MPKFPKDQEKVYPGECSGLCTVVPEHPEFPEDLRSPLPVTLQGLSGEVSIGERPDAAFKREHGLTFPTTPPTPIVSSCQLPSGRRGAFNATGPIARHPAWLGDIVAGLEAYRLPPCCVRLTLTGRARGVARWLPRGPPAAPLKSDMMTIGLVGDAFSTLVTSNCSPMMGAFHL